MRKEEISYFRKTHRLTQQELADLVGTNKSNVSAYERGFNRIPKWFEIRFSKLTDELGIEREGEVQPDMRFRRMIEDVSDTIKEEPSVQKPLEVPVEEYVEKDLATKMVELQEKLLNDSVGSSRKVIGIEDIIVNQSFDRPDSDHYHTGSIDVWQFAEENFSPEELLGFHRINAIKYIARYGKKNGKNPKDLEKAIACMKEILRLEGDL